MNLVKHARRELRLCGQLEEDPEYSKSIIDAVRAFASYGHAGGSAMIAREQLHALLGFKTLSPLTSDPGEWIDQSEASGRPFWQNKRDPSFFSEDGGKTWYGLDEGTQEMPDEYIDYQLAARKLVLDYITLRRDRTDTYPFTLEDVFVTWFSKTLRNWKAMVSTTVPDGMYYEVTHDGEHARTYLDAYKKWENISVDDRAVLTEDDISRPQRM